MKREMGFQYDETVSGGRDVYGESMVESDEEETLSLCDMPLYHSAGMAAELASTHGVSGADSSDNHDFHFDLDFAGSTSPACGTSAADDLFFNGCLLPSSESTARSSYNDSNSLGQNGILSNEQLQAWRADSLESRSSYWTSSESSRRRLNYSASHKGLRRGNSTAASNKSKGMTNRTSFSSGSYGKTSSTWLQFFTLGINKTPVMKLEDMRLRQCKAVEKSILKRSVSSYYEEGPILMKKAAIFHQRSKSVKEKKRAMQTPRTKGFRILPLFTSLNSCKSISSVINCTKKPKCVDREGLVSST